MEEKNKVDMLNILRFVAFMMIFLLHTKGFIPVKWNENCGKAWMLYTPAWAGTWIFFLLSGYGIGAGFYSGKYKMSVNGIAHFYLRRITAVLPIYWFWIFTIAIFVKPEILQLSVEHITYLLKLFFFDYQEEFYSAEFGLGWYMTTLMRLYLVAPLGFFILRKTISSKRQTLLALILIILAGFVARCFMGYHIAVTGKGNWSPNIYKPFYYNFDIFFSGMLLNQLKDHKKEVSQRHKTAGRIIAILALLLLVLVNCHIYYDYAYGKSDYLNVYCYVFPSVYIGLTAFYIYYFEIQRDYRQTKLTMVQCKKNWMRIFDYFQKIQFPIYLFHSAILLCLADAYDKTFYKGLCKALLIPKSKYNFAIGCLYTLFAFVISVIWAILVQQMFAGVKKSKFRSYLEQIDYSVSTKKMVYVLQRVFPL